MSFGRTFRVAEGSRMNVYILLDTSGSIKKQDFEISRNATIALIRKVCAKWAHLIQQEMWVKDRQFIHTGPLVCLSSSLGGCETYMSSSFLF